MSDDSEGTEPQGPDLAVDGVEPGAIPDGGMLLGHANGEEVVLARRGDHYFGFGAECTHYHGPLAEGLFDGACVRCPWHHAAFDVTTGEAARPPAFDSIATFQVFERGGRLYAGVRTESPRKPAPVASPPASVVIVGAGAAGAAAADMLRREGFAGRVTVIGAEPDQPYDRPNCSKDYLAGNAPEEWMPLRSAESWAEQKVDLLTGTRCTAVDTAKREVLLDDGRTVAYDRLLLATGCNPIRLDTPGGDLPHVHYLRTLADARGVIASATNAQRALVVGASFIGLEVAASLRTRGLEVHVVAPESRPMERILGPELGEFIRGLHREHGVQFHLEHTVARIEERSVTLDDGSKLDAELVVFGVGVRPALDLAQQAGLTIENGVVVDEYLQTSAPDVYAAGDIARWPDAYTGERIRVEHWAVAERQGQTAARNMLGKREPFDLIPFFWSQHYDVSVNYVGHAQKWDRVDVSGSVEDRDCTVAYRSGGKTLAVASIYRDIESLQAELAMERRDEAALQRLIPAG